MRSWVDQSVQELLHQTLSEVVSLSFWQFQQYLSVSMHGDNDWIGNETKKDAEV